MPESTQVRRDCLAAALLAVVYLIPFHTLASLPGVPRWLAALLVLAAVVPAGGRRIALLAVLGVVTVASAVVMGLSSSPPLPLSVAFVMYLVPMTLPRRTGWWLLGGALAALGAGLALYVALPHGPLAHGSARTALTLLLASALLVGGAWLAGDWVRERRLSAALVREQADRAVREEIAEARRAATATRVEIARELHDVVAHSLSLIAVQAGVAGWVGSSSPDASSSDAARALASIEEISRGALREMRVLLGVLRTEDSTAARLDPAGRLADLEELAARVSAAGVAVSVSVTGTARPLPAGLDLAAYRVAQEALTNVIKHARATRCEVAVRHAADSLTLEITDDGAGAGRGPGSGPPGHGIAGMRERVAMYGGDFSAEPFDGGFRVRARFPLTGQATA